MKSIHNNAHINTANVIQIWFDENGIPLVNWPHTHPV